MADETLLKSTIARISSWTVPVEQEPTLRRGFYASLLIWPLAFFVLPLILDALKRFLPNDFCIGLAIVVPQFVMGAVVVSAMAVDGNILKTLNLQHWEWRFLAIGVGLALPVLLLNGGVITLWVELFNYLGFPLPDETALEIIIKDAGTGLFVSLAIMAIVLAPVVEEIVFRRVLFGFTSTRYGAPIALFLTSAVFALIHLDWKNLPGLFILGMVFQVTTLLCRSLWPAIIMHSTNNTIAMGLLYAVREGWIEL